MKTREQLISLSAEKIAMPAFKLVFGHVKLPFKRNYLEQLPEGTLGKDLHHFLIANKLEALPYFYVHDLKHILLGYDTSLVDEACLQFFSLGNRYFTPFSVLSTLAFMIVLPEHRSKFKAAYRRGRLALPLWQTDLTSMLHLSTEEVKAHARVNL